MRRHCGIVSSMIEIYDDGDDDDDDDDDNDGWCWC